MPLHVKYLRSYPVRLYFAGSLFVPPSLCLCLKLTFYLYARFGKILVNSVLTVDFYESKFDNFEFEGGFC